MMRALLILLLTSLALAACGFKGGLYLPKSNSTASAPVASAVSGQ
ncbi:LPS translocon maturation chaperone LptM [Iodobacter fluviatilis]|nr:lipoprotein [Iodobacter fluviatilis]